MEHLQIAVESRDIQVEIGGVVAPAFDDDGAGERNRLCLSLSEIYCGICQIPPATGSTAAAVKFAECEVWLLNPDNISRAGAEVGEQIILKAGIEQVEACGCHHANRIDAFDHDCVGARGLDLARRGYRSPRSIFFVDQDAVHIDYRYIRGGEVGGHAPEGGCGSRPEVIAIVATSAVRDGNHIRGGRIDGRVQNAAIAQRRGGENLLKGWRQAQIVRVAHRKTQCRKVLRSGDGGAGDRSGRNFLNHSSQRAARDFQNVCAASGGAEAQVRSGQRCARNGAESSGCKRGIVKGDAQHIHAFAQVVSRASQGGGEVGARLSMGRESESKGKDSG